MKCKACPRKYIPPEEEQPPIFIPSSQFPHYPQPIYGEIIVVPRGRSYNDLHKTPPPWLRAEINRIEGIVKERREAVAQANEETRPALQENLRVAEAALSKIMEALALDKGVVKERLRRMDAQIDPLNESLRRMRGELLIAVAQLGGSPDANKRDTLIRKVGNFEQDLQRFKQILSERNDLYKLYQNKYNLNELSFDRKEAKRSIEDVDMRLVEATEIALISLPNSLVASTQKERDENGMKQTARMAVSNYLNILEEYAEYLVPEEK